MTLPVDPLNPHVRGESRMEVWNRVQATPDAILEEMTDRIIEGWSLRRIAHTNRWPALQFVNWIESDEERLALYQSALKLAAEYHADKILELTENATMEDYQLRNFQTKNHQWFASKYDRSRFGDDKMNVGVAVGNITIVHESS